MNERNSGRNYDNVGQLRCLGEKKRLSADHLFPKIRFASSNVSFDPMSYQIPGTFHV